MVGWRVRRPVWGPESRVAHFRMRRRSPQGEAWGGGRAVPLVVMGEVGVFGGGEGGREVPPNSRVAMRRRAWPGVSVIWLIWVEVRLLLKEVVVVGVGLVVVMPRGLRVVLVLGARRGRPVVVIDGAVGVKDGLVLVVVDHHAADHTADSVAHHLVGAGLQRWLLGH